MKNKLLIFSAVIATAGHLAWAQETPPAKPAEEKDKDKPAEPAEIKVFTLTDEERAAGWRILFDGKNNYGLRGLTYNDFINRGWKIGRGSLFCLKEIKDMGKMTGGHLITEDQYTDFEFAFEWKLSVSGKSGIMYMALGTAAKPEGLVYSIIDDVHHPDGLKGGPIRRSGALYNFIPPSADKTLHPPEQWNEGRILVEGNHVQHFLNGAVVVDYTLGSPQFQALVTAYQKQQIASKIKPNPNFGKKVKTALVIEDDGEEVEFRNLRIRPIYNSAAPTTTPAATGAR